MTGSSRAYPSFVQAVLLLGKLNYLFASVFSIWPQGSGINRMI